ncbi:MAG TPA: LytTR family DNA-binding domain-containing protein [Gemmatimonadales bacterium]|nr:LytTR family DNA-binding domain-containing protein [Gemmatimonadales bacterium]
MSRGARRVVIADDEPFARERLRMLLAPHDGWTVVAECEHGAEAVEAILRERPDLVFLDVRMPELSGLEVAEALEARLRGSARVPAVVFVTAHEEFALKAFEVRALDYLLKPVDAGRLARTLERVAERLDGAPAAALDAGLREVLAALDPSAAYPRRFLVRGVRGELYFVRAADIDWAEARGNYVRLHAGGQAHLVRDTMQAFEAKLDPATFVRVHRSAIVNLDHVRKLEPYARGEYVVTLRDGTRLRTSRVHGARLHALLE